MTFSINHLAPFLLTNLLLGQRVRRIVHVSSDAHQSEMLDFDDLGFKRGYFGFKAYARSKPANVLFTCQLARRLGAGGVTVKTLHPGHFATEIWKTNFSVFGLPLKWMMGLFALSPGSGRG